jgi:voltage-gated potassium channel
MTVNLLTTVGDDNITLTDVERIWAMLLMISGVLTVFYIGINLVAFIVDGELRALLGRRQLQNKINQLNNHMVVCGFGRMGRELCAALEQRHVPFVLIDINAEKTAIADDLGYLYLHGSAMDGEILRAARLEHARGLAACLTSDADNVFVTLTARGLASKLNITARAENTESQETLHRAGADRVICPPVLGANKIMRMLLNPAIDELMELASDVSELEVVKVFAHELPQAHGKTLQEMALPSQTGVIVVSITAEDGSRQFNPSADTQLNPKDEMIVIGSVGGVDRMLKKWGAQDAGV